MGCKKDDDDDNAPPQQVQTLSVTDSVFIKNASLSNIAEIDLGQLAASKATDDSIRAFGAFMVNEHTLAQNDLNALALQKNVSIPQEPDSLHKAIKQQLQVLNGYKFDSLYISTQVVDHQKAQQIFNTEINSGQDQDVINYANKYLPHINEHLQKATQLKSKIVK
ncbi:membrane protein [Sporocytophaga myxococcoides]|uniref:Membrane protein n=2 Tax=Sporocytophaga myxococcoides TaxID=153721 RepID=A0A098LNF0_9BACT|nr:membrane protein [Sporocytophaga myxococcoides]